VQFAGRIAFENPNSDLARVAKIRVGDLYRLLGRGKEAVENYRAVQKTVTDETQGRKFAAQDRGYSITIADLIAQGYRFEAEAKLAEWEIEHPMAKFDSDFLLLRARVLMLFGRWNEALQEIDSFGKMNPDSPYQIPADYYRARALYELGKKDEARSIWQEILTKYPKSDLVDECRQWLSRR
jgi:tetratricopeptide (TPR) repeat protein